MNSFTDSYNQTKALFEDNLRQYISSFDYYREISEAMKYSLNAGGKRLRPVLMIECAKLLGLPAEKIMPLAVAIEMIHTYSLIHDDLPSMDNDNLRRGKPTNHIVFGEDMAILAGDGLLNLAMEISLQNADKANYENYIEALEVLFASSGAKGMVGGQAIDIKHTDKLQSLQKLELMHSKKTGALFSSACLCPALLSGSNDGIIKRLEDYSSYLGLLFQIKDDILDVVGDQSRMGKTIGKDEADNKSTFISLMGLEKSIAYADEVAKKAAAPLESFGQKSVFLKGLIQYILERNN